MLPLNPENTLIVFLLAGPGTMLQLRQRSQSKVIKTMWEPLGTKFRLPRHGRLITPAKVGAGTRARTRAKEKKKEVSDIG
jgi:hypothetical protein